MGNKVRDGRLIDMLAILKLGFKKDIIQLFFKFHNFCKNLSNYLIGTVFVLIKKWFYLSYKNLFIPENLNDYRKIENPSNFGRKNVLPLFY